MIANQPTKLETMLFGSSAGFDAAKSTPRRKGPRVELRSTDDILRRRQRDKLTSSARDARNNFGLVGWMIRKHLDFVSDFTFQANTPNKEFNKQLNKKMRDHCRPKSCHVAGRHSLRRLLRIIEACRTLDGDVLVEKMKDTSVNLIRADRVRNPPGTSNNEQWKNGVKIDRRKRPVAYQVHTRTTNGRMIPEKQIPAGNAILHGYFVDDADQQRGVGLLVDSLPTQTDLREGLDYSLARLKIEQLFGIYITRNALDGTNPFIGNQQYATADDATDEEIAEAEAAENKSGKVDYGEGIWQTELEEGEDIKMVQGNSPSANHQNHFRTCLEMVLKSLDLPTSFWDESHTNFFGSRGALQLYKRSATHKQADNQEMLYELTEWLLVHWIVDGEIELPKGWTIRDVEFQWIPRGIPWWDRSKEIVGDMRAIAAGLDNPIDVCLDHGTGTPFENIDKTAEVLEYAETKLKPFGLQLNFTPTETNLTTAPKNDAEDDEQE